MNPSTTSTRYELFPGIDVTYHQYQANHMQHQHSHLSHVLEINHCRHGRIGWQMEHALTLYLGEGDLSLHMTDNCTHAMLSFPLGYYEGISFTFNFQELLENTPELLQECDIDLSKLRDTFCDTNKTTALPASRAIEHIFDALYDLPEHLVLPYCKLKCQELLLFLSQLSLNNAPRLNPYDSAQVQLVNEIHTLLTTNLDVRYTIEDLSKQYLINTSTLKAAFKAVYGLPIASYMKQYRMHQAAALLRDTDKSIAEIAVAVGYENQSKFSSAFKNVVGILPTTYRKNYS